MKEYGVIKIYKDGEIVTLTDFSDTVEAAKSVAQKDWQSQAYRAKDILTYAVLFLPSVGTHYVGGLDMAGFPSGDRPPLVFGPINQDEKKW